MLHKNPFLLCFSVCSDPIPGTAAMSCVKTSANMGPEPEKYLMTYSFSSICREMLEMSQYNSIKITGT